MKNNNTVVPVVGMGATAGYGSDCYPYTVVEVSKSGKRVWVQQDNWTPTAKHTGITGNQDYTYTPNPNARKRLYTLRKNGRFHEEGCSMKYGGLALGSRHYYYDPHF